MPDDTERLVVQLEARVRDFEKQMQKAAGTAETAYGRMRRGSRGATDQMADDMMRSTSRINQALAAASTKIGTFGKAFAGGLVGGLVAGGLEGFARRIKGIVSELADLNDAAQRVGLTTKAFQELSFGFKLAGVEAADFETNMMAFTKRIGEAATKGGTLRKIFDANNIALRDQNGAIRSSEALLRDYAELIKNATGEQEQMVLATEAFGRAGGDMVLALKEGAAGIDDMAKAAAEAGGVIDDELIKKAAELDDRFDAMWRTFEVNGKSAILEVLTALDAVSAKITDIGNASVFRWLAENLPTWGGADMTILDPDLARARGEALGPDARIRQAFAGGAPAGSAALIAELQKRYGGGAGASPATVIPGEVEKTERARAKATRAIKEETEALKEARKAHELYQETLELERDLLFERQQLFRDPIEQRVYAELRDLGIDIDSVRGEQLAKEIRLTEQLYEQVDGARELAGILADAFAEPLREGENMFDRLIGKAGELGAALQKAVGGKAGAGIGGALSGLGAGFGSADPLMGGLAGALGGLASGGFTPLGLIGAGAGLIGGIVGGIIGKEKQRQEEARKSAEAIAETERQLASERLRIAQEAVEQAIAAAQARVDAARSTLSDSYQRETSALSQLASEHRSFAANLRQSLDALRLNPALTSLSPGERLAEAERQYQAARAAGPQGDLAGAMNRFAEEALSYYGATADYFAILARIEQEGQLAAATAEATADTATQQLAAMEAQYAPLLGIEQNTLTTAQAMQALLDAQASLVAAGGGPSWGSGVIGGVNAPGNPEAIRGFAHGGDFTVGGRGGTDTTMVRFRATPGERVSIRTPQQSNDNGSGAIVSALRAELGAVRDELAKLTRETRFAADERKRRA